MDIDELLARQSIQDTLARYNIAGDRLKAGDYAACFTEDGIVEARHSDPNRCFRYEGRDAILRWQERWLERSRSGARVHSASFARHHLTTSQIDLTGADTAEGRTYWIAWTDIGPDHAGTYSDRFRKVGDRWLISERLVREDWRAPDSLFSTAVANSR